MGSMWDEESKLWVSLLRAAAGAILAMLLLPVVIYYYVSWMDYWFQPLIRQAVESIVRPYPKGP